MKKLLAVLSIALLVVGAVTIFSMAEDTAIPQPSASDAPAQTASPSVAGAGSVYYLNFKPEQSQQWQALAKTYTEQTGVPVTVVTAASGTYEDTLRSEMEKADAPTLFQVNGPVGLKTWRDYCLDLRDTALYRNLKSRAGAGNRVCDRDVRPHLQPHPPGQVYGAGRRGDSIRRPDQQF